MNQPKLLVKPVAEPYWEGLAAGQLLFQRCSGCGCAQLPPRVNCTRCLSPDLAWERSKGDGELVSWVVYHVAYHPSFEGKTPYNVAIVKLDEGPNLVTNIIGTDDRRLRIGLRVILDIQTEDGQNVARFRINDNAGQQ